MKKIILAMAFTVAAALPFTLQATGSKQAKKHGTGKTRRPQRQVVHRRSDGIWVGGDKR